MTTTSIIALSVLFLYALVSRRLEHSILTGPLIFTGLGLLMGLGSLFVGQKEQLQGFLHLLAEITLIFVLFGDASRIHLASLRKAIELPARLLLLGMPLAIFFGAGFALALFTELSTSEAFLMGALLAPTDAALGQAVVSMEEVPKRIRYALNVESGLNDGVALPLILVLIAIGAEDHSLSVAEWANFALFQIVLGPLMGVLVGGLGAVVLKRQCVAGTVTSPFERLAGFAIAGLCYLVAEAVGGNGFISAFVGGLAFGNLAGPAVKRVHMFLETEGQLLMLAVFLLFGALRGPQVLWEASLEVWLYALASLTVIRMLSVYLALRRTRLRFSSELFIGWFGPRGLATILFAFMILQQKELPHGALVAEVGMATALLSIVAHGVTAVPLSHAYSRLVAKQPEKCERELAPSPEPVTRALSRAPTSQQSEAL